ARPLAVSQLLAAALQRQRLGIFREEDAVAVVESMLAELPEPAFVDPVLRAHPERRVRQALRIMQRRGFLHRDGDTYRQGEVRHDPRFPDVDDIIAYQARFHDETVAALRELGARGA
ncbi:MAG TPA: hypothetical protein VF171_08790, partial [Trueperaceae bacterium]